MSGKEVRVTETGITHLTVRPLAGKNGDLLKPLLFGFLRLPKRPRVVDTAMVLM